MSTSNKDTNILFQNIGIAGCGEMGYPMLKKLLQNNVRATGYDIKSENNFVEFGANFISSKFNNAANIIYSNEINEDVDCTLASINKLNK